LLLDDHARGSLALSRYSIAVNCWASVHGEVLRDQDQAGASPALHVSADGALHLAWIGRYSADDVPEYALAYARSKNGGATWTKSDGTPLSLPITAVTAEHVQRLPADGSSLPQPLIGSDRSGRPFLGTFLAPGPGEAPRFTLAQWCRAPRGIERSWIGSFQSASAEQGGVIRLQVNAGVASRGGEPRANLSSRRSSG